MENVIIYKRVPVSDNKAIVSALRDGYMVLMPNLSNGVAKSVPHPQGNKIAKRKRRTRRAKGPAPTAAKRLRDAEIVQLKAKGWGPTAIGKRYGLSCARVCQILATKTPKASTAARVKA